MNLAKSKDTQLTIAAVAAGVDGAVVDSAAIDCQGKDRALFELIIGATAAENGIVALTLVDCATSDGTFAAISGATISHTNGASGETSKIYQIDAKLSKRYLKIRYQRTVANTAFLAGVLSLYDGKMLPVAQNAAVKEQVVI